MQTKQDRYYLTKSRGDDWLLCFYSPGLCLGRAVKTGGGIAIGFLVSRY